MHRRSALALAAAALTGCAGDSAETSTPTVPAVEEPPPDPTSVGYPYGTPAGLPPVDAGLDRSSATRFDLSTDSPVAAVVSTFYTSVPTVVATTDDGAIRGWRVRSSGASTVPVESTTRAGLPAVSGSPESDGGLRARSGGGPSGHPVATGVGFAWVRADGALVLRGASDATGKRDATLDVDALPDGRPTVADGLVHVLAEPTTDYAHGILGDDREPTAVVTVDPSSGTVVNRRPAPTGTVIEDLWPRVVPFDGRAHALVTVSDSDSGARVAALGPDGHTVSGPPIGSGFRWRHVLAVGPFGPAGVQEVAVVKTPHIGGVAEFYRREGDRFRLVAERSGYATHRIGERTLATAVAGRFGPPGDDRLGLLVPTTGHDALALLAREGDGVEEVERLALGGTLTSNLAVSDGVVAAGTDDGLRVWTDA